MEKAKSVFYRISRRSEFQHADQAQQLCKVAKNEQRLRSKYTAVKDAFGNWQPGHHPASMSKAVTDLIREWGNPSDYNTLYPGSPPWTMECRGYNPPQQAASHHRGLRGTDEVKAPYPIEYIKMAAMDAGHCVSQPTSRGHESCFGSSSENISTRAAAAWAKWNQHSSGTPRWTELCRPALTLCGS